MSSEWMKVMLEEISRKKGESEQARTEERQREDERQRHVAPERHDEAERKADPTRQAVQVSGDQPAAPSGSGVDRARG
jgi:hypothetical protein